MKKTSSIKWGALTAALCTSTAGWIGAQTTPVQPQPGRIGDDPATGRPVPGQLQDSNKASKLIGMNVQNQSGEKLGTIQDIVIDLQGDRIAYCVLAVDPGILKTEKLHAVPLRAFRASSDGNALVLNADKDKLAKAEGFDRNSWPSAMKREWGAQPFWQEGATEHRKSETQKDD